MPDRAVGPPPTALEALMATAVGRWKAADAACNGTMGDCTDGQDVETLHDTGSGGNNFTQSTAAYKPLYVASGPNGQPALTFDGTDDYMTAGDVLDSTFAGTDSDFAIVMVYVTDDATGGAILSKFTNNGDDDAFLLYANVSGLGGDCQDGDYALRYFINGEVARSRWGCSGHVSKVVEYHSLLLNYDGSADTNDGLDRMLYYTDKYQDYPPTVGSAGTLGDIADTTAPLYLGAWENVGGAFGFVDFRVAETIVFADPLSAEQITTLNTYLTDTYGIIRPPPEYAADWRADQAACSGTQGDCTNGQTAETLHDLGYSASNMTNASGTDVPTYVTTGPSGLAAIDFDGTDDYYSAGDVLDSVFAGASSNFDVLIIAADDEATDIDAVFGKWDNTTSGREFYMGMDASGSNAGPQFTVSDVGTANDYWSEGYEQTSLGDYHYMLFSFDSSSARDAAAEIVAFDSLGAITDTTYVDLGAGQTISDTTSHLMMGAINNSFPTNYFNGRVAEVIVYPRNLSAAEISGLLAYANNRYGTFLSPPLGYDIWLSADDTAGDDYRNTDVADAATISSWVTKGSKAFTMSTGTGPIMRSPCDGTNLNSKPCADFDGSTMSLGLDNNTAKQDTNSYTMCWVVSYDTVGADDNFFHIEGSTNLSLTGSDVTTGGSYSFSASVTTGTITAGQFDVVCQYLAGVNADAVSINDSVSTSAVEIGYGSTALDDCFMLGAESSSTISCSPTNHADVKILEYWQKPGGDYRDAFYDYAATKYGAFPQ